MRVRPGAGRTGKFALACAALVAVLHAGGGTAGAAVGHVVQPGESLWSISFANNLTTRTVAAFNGLSEDAMVVIGETIQVPTVEEGAAALAAAGTSPTTSSSGASHLVQPGESLWSVAVANGISIDALAAANGLSADAYLIIGETISVPASGSSTTSAASGSTYGLGHIPSPYGELHLDPAAADSWNSMRDDALANHGVDIYPGGTASAYRTYEQQAYLYDLYLSGQGAPANPPGTSTHEVGIAVDVAEPVMRDVIDQIGYAYGWSGTIPSEWWHVQFGW